MTSEQATLESKPASGGAEAHADAGEREIQEDVMNVPFVAWLGAVSTILIAVSVILLTGVFYLTKGNEEALRQSEADARKSDLQAQREVDAMVLDGYYKFPDKELENGDMERGGISIPIAEGMNQVIEASRDR